jgi:hypothetical protein
MHEVETALVIAAPCSRVWDLLMDFPSYPSWNPFLPRVEGKPVVGEQLTLRMRTAGLPDTTLKPMVMYVVPQHYFSWRGPVINALILQGEHYFELQPRGEHACHLRHGERFTGLLASANVRFMGARLAGAFMEMNVALRTRAEAATPVPLTEKSRLPGQARAASTLLDH